MPEGWTAEKDEAIRVRINMSTAELTPGQTVRYGAFWAIYLMMAPIAFTGLVVTAQLKPIAAFYQVDKAVVAFGLQSLTIIALLQFIHRPIWFIALSGLAFFSWGEIFSLFPSVTGDLFGRQYATANYGIVYTATGLASIFAGPVAALASQAAGSWVPVLWAMVICSAVDAVLTLVLLTPLARRTVRASRTMPGIRTRTALSMAGESD